MIFPFLLSKKHEAEPVLPGVEVEETVPEGYSGESFSPSASQTFRGRITSNFSMCWL